MSEQVIPAEAVKAAAKEFAAISDPRGEWEKQTPGYHRHYFVLAKRILEAGAPCMLQDAYEKGWEDGREGTRRRDNFG